ncbi:MAG TPA: cation-transporting P-type ATPase [Propionibacteriaceae bacterium]|nr:cation-transporting P-type ATPase [Propionibacteriaceae bacterium]
MVRTLSLPQSAGTVDETVQDTPSPRDRISELEPSEALTALASRPEGLTTLEVAERQARYGPNTIATERGTPVIVEFLRQFVSLMAWLLWFGGAVAFFAHQTELGVAIWMVNVINGVFSFWQEYRAERATAELKKMLATFSRVVRDGDERQVPSDQLVPGDVVVLGEGDRVTADARLLAAADLHVDQSTLTGESRAVRKSPDPIHSEGLSATDTPNLLFAGTNVSRGTGRAVVTTIGMATAFGRIAGLTQSMRDQPSPLQRELDRLTKQLSAIALGMGLLFFLLGVFVVSEPWPKAFIFALGMVVAFIPEGLLPTVTLSLAMAVQRMSRQHALVKKLSAVETLGCTTVICSDKTGTLTQNEMTVSNLWLPSGAYDVTGRGYAPIGEIRLGGTPVVACPGSDLYRLLAGAALCSDARLVPPDPDSDRYTVLGDPTEACLAVVAAKGGVDVAVLQREQPRIRELPFDSRRKRMTTIHALTRRAEAGALPRTVDPLPETGMPAHAVSGPIAADTPSASPYIAYVKGAPKEVLALCTTITRDGVREPITDADRLAVMAANDAYARDALRVLAVAYRPLGGPHDRLPKLADLTQDAVEQELTFVGLVAMADPPRTEVAEAVETCRRAHIRIIMVTGDYGLTAESIAKRIGIVESVHPRVVSGAELETLTDAELDEALSGEVIFARVAPEQKFRVVTRLKELGEVVAVTGDGVNDAPALKKADIGVAMGIAGTDVAKEAADIILTDDNFASIVRAIEEGRGVYGNIRKFLTYILTSNMSEGAPSAAFLLSRGGIPLPLTVMQILTVDLGTDMVPALGLGTERPEPGVMDRPPRGPTERLMNRSVLLKAFAWYGLLETAFSMTAYFFVNLVHGWPGVPLATSGPVYEQATTMTLAAIVLCQVGAVLNCRTDATSLVRVGLLSNRQVLVGIAVELVLLCAISYVPFMQEVFGTAAIGPLDWLYLVVLPVPMVALDELRKSVARRRAVREGGRQG